jgi:peptidoglycan/LPS O-acetylase OafA/YrhL
MWYRSDNNLPFVGGTGVYWSLEVEELFYLLWAPVILKCSRKTILVFAIAPLVVCPIVRGLAHTPNWYEYFSFVPRFDTLAVGGCLALLFRAKPNLPKWVILAPIPPLLAALGWLCVHCGLFRDVEVRSTESFSIFGYSLLASLFGCVIGACVQWEKHPALAPLRLKPIVYIGTISYTMYLIHLEIYLIFSKIISEDLLRGVVAMSLTVVLAALSWKYFESPILRLRNWPERKRRREDKSLAATAD